MIHALLRTGYVRTMRGARALARGTGILDLLDGAQSRRSRWLRSLLAIYDFDDLARLDLPWWTFDAVEAVEAYLREHPQARVFEWGSGASTLWLSRRAGEVTSVEHDPHWGEMVSGRLAERQNVRLRTVPAQAEGVVPSAKPGFEGQYFDDYVAAIREEEGLFDLIVIDGRAREACLAEAMSRLAPGGVILLDDFKRGRYQAAARESGLSTRRLDGLAVCLPLPDSTALLSRG